MADLTQPNAGQPTLSRLGRWLAAQVQLPIALSVLASGLLLLYPLVARIVAGEHLDWFSRDTWRESIEAIGLAEVPRILIGGALLLTAPGLAFRARVAWTFSTVLMLPMLAAVWYLAGDRPSPLFLYNAAVFCILVYFWPAFGRSSLAAGTLFALASVLSLICYALLGLLYLGSQFNPPITNIAQATYFGIVAMSTVGFGDIVPVTHVSRLFVLSIIILGIMVFATSLGAVIGPIVGGRLRQIIQRKARQSMRKDHVILCGATPLALNLFEALTGRGKLVTVVLHPRTAHPYPETADMIAGDPSSAATLLEAGVMTASHVLALQDDDADNAFIVLTVKSFDHCEAKTVALVNANHNLEKIRRTHPDLAFSPQMLGAELLSRALLGETFDNKLVTDMLFGRRHKVSH